MAQVTGERWYGPGYCGLCQTAVNVVVCRVKFWHPYKGWRVGDLCTWCAEHGQDRGPRPEDYAYRRRGMGKGGNH